MGQTLRRNSKNLRRDRFAPSWELRRKTTWLLRLSCSTLTKSVPLTVHQTTSHRNWDLRIVRKYFQSESKCKSTSLSKLRKGERKGDSGICQLSTQTSHPIYIAETLKEVPAEKSFNPGKGRRGKPGWLYWIGSSWRQPSPPPPSAFQSRPPWTLDLHLEALRLLRPNRKRVWGLTRLSPEVVNSKSNSSVKLLICWSGWLSKRSSTRQRTPWAKRSTKPSPMRSWKRSMGFTSR